MWGGRVIVPDMLRAHVLDQLHEGHLGVVKIKALARSYVWWPEVNNAIETVTKQCSGCFHERNTPALAPLHPWEWPAKNKATYTC